jgi:spermidine synthase
VEALLWICFAVSGGAALALETLWMRSAGLVLGTTAPTAATVLACCFAGLALGAVAGGRRASRPVRRYALLELGVVAGTLWSLAVFASLPTEPVQSALALLGAPGLVVAVAAALLPATACLGGTLPALGGALASGAAGKRGGLLCAINTAGAALGAALGGFGLPAAIGVRATYAAAIGASALAAGVAFAVGDRPSGAGAASSADSARPRRRGLLYLTAAFTGALGIGLEVLWTRLFAQVLHNSVYSFTAVVIVFLLAIAAGAGLAALLLRRAAPEAVAGAALACAGLATIGGYWIFVRSTDGLAYVGMRSGLAEYLLRIVGLAGATAGPAALASAAVLPALWSAWGVAEGAARPLGMLAAANAFGGAVGALGAGFVVIPTIGVRGGLLVAAVVYLLLAGRFLSTAGGLRALAAGAVLVAVVGSPLRTPVVALRTGREALRAVIEGASGIVSVVDTGDDLQLRLDNYYVLGGSAAAANQRRQGLVPLLLHPDPHRAAFIGLATGTTASAAPALGVEQTTVVELVPEVAAAARTHFAPWNAGLLERPDVRLVVDDGRRYLAAGDERFDVVVSDLFIPWHAGAGNLYAREMYEGVARRLAPGGLFCQWLPLYQLTREEFDVITHTFLGVFPEVGLWRDDFYPDRPVVGLVGQLALRPLDLARVEERVARLPQWGRDPLLAAPRGLLMLYVGDLHAVSDLFVHADVNTDDRPVIEFLAPRLTRMTAAGDKDWFTGEALASFYDTMETRVIRKPDARLPASDEVAEARRAGSALYRHALAAARHDAVASARYEAEVRRLVPEVILAAEAEDGEAGSSDARRTLAGLQAAEEELRRQIEATERRLAEMTGHAP